MAITPAHDVVSTSPTNTFATLNNLLQTTVTLSDGNLKCVVGNAATKTFSNFLLPNTGKWYWEVVYTDFTSDGCVGIAEVGCNLSSHLGNETTSYGLRPGNKVTNSTNTSYGTTYGVNDVVRVLWDGDNRQISFGVNATMYAVAFTVSSDKDYYPAFSDNGSTSSSTFYVNFGQDSSFGGNKTSGSANATDGNGIGDFYYDPPTVSGTKALALCTSNIQSSLAIDPASDNLPEDFFVCHKYTGTGSAQDINTLPFSPDLVWIKNRDTGLSHVLADSVRGDGNFLATNGTGVEDTDTSKFNQFITNGFSIGTHNGVNENTKKHIAWCWKAGGNSNTFNIDDTGYTSYDNLQSANSSLPASSTSGMITPSGMSIGVKQGFSIVKYTGNGSIPHGLSSPLDFLIVKNLDLAGEGWTTWHSSFSSGDYVYLNSTQQKYNSTGKFSGVPTSTVFQVGADNSTGSSSYNYIAYCFTSVPGYSAFGSYEGNESTNNFVYTGHKPAFLLIKRYSTTSTFGSWCMYDNARDPHNVMNTVLYANKDVAEGYRGDGSTTATDIYIDFLSNGFNLKISKTEHNVAGSYLFASFAEMPFKYAATNAR